MLVIKSAFIGLFNVKICFNQVFTVAPSHITYFDVFQRHVFLEKTFSHFKHIFSQFLGVFVNIKILNDLPLKFSFIGQIIIYSHRSQKTHPSRPSIQRQQLDELKLPKIPVLLFWRLCKSREWQRRIVQIVLLTFGVMFYFFFQTFNKENMKLSHILDVRTTTSISLNWFKCRTLSSWRKRNKLMLLPGLNSSAKAKSISHRKS